MPEFLAPGVFVEETGLRARPIEGVSTGTAAFVGPTLAGALPQADDAAWHEALTSFGEFERRFGGLGDLRLGDRHATNHLAHAAKAFFDNGGRRLIVARLEAGDGDALTRTHYQVALDALAAVDEVSIVAAPGLWPLTADGFEGQAVQRALVAHAEAPRAYRFAVLDAPPGLAVPEVLAWRGGGGAIDSPHAALYYPGVVVTDWQRAGRELLLPPSGFVCGVYARSDLQRGVFEAPANEPVIGALRFERAVDRADQELLNPAGVNVLREFAGRGLRVAGARTLSSDSDWKYVNVRRYVTFLEASIDRGTQWAVFEPNGERLWAGVRVAVSDFLLAQWHAGALLGRKPEEAFFVRCDRSTMTQNDLDNGRMICLVGVATLRPAEFVILRIGQWTADAKH